MMVIILGKSINNVLTQKVGSNKIYES